MKRQNGNGTVSMDLYGESILARAREMFAELAQLGEASRVETINALRKELHTYSPFSAEPVDCVQWINVERIVANDYNPNAVAPPEMKLLEHSIKEDGYTQPIVAWFTGEHYEVVDGFHRNRVGRECASVRSRIRGYLPLAVINTGREDRGDRIAATIRHNRARGKHRVDAMSDIVVELKRRNWSDERIGNELGMDPDEVLRLCQISGLAEMFSQREFSEAWEHTGPAVEIADTDSVDEVQENPQFLEWMKGMDRALRSAGWHDRTENSSILYGESGQHLGLVQKSHFKEEWFWYAYTQPMQEGRADSRERAKAEIEKRRT